MKFIDKITSRLDSINSHVCVGLDSNYERIPEILKKSKSVSQTIFDFNKNVILATHNVAIAYKINLAFYAGFGAEGLEGLRLTNHYLKKHYTDIPILADCKRSEMGESVKMLRQEIVDWLGFDCIMITPWFGFDTVKDLLHDSSLGVCIFVHDSNPTAAEFQDLELTNGKHLYEEVTEHVVKSWNTNGNIFVEAGATYPKQLRRVRQIVGNNMVILTAGVGAQGGKAEDVTGIFGKDGKRLLVNSSRGIIFAGEGKRDYFLAVKEAAEKLRKNLLGISLLRL